jgi:kexin
MSLYQILSDLLISRRDENPVGDWTLVVSDQNNSNNGSFLGWSMSLWGSAIDAAQAVLYELPDDPNEGHNLPPHPTTSDQTKQHPKPTEALPEDHAFQTGTPIFPSGTATGLPEAIEEGYFTHMYDLLTNQLWLIGAIGIVVVFGIGAGAFFWLRKRKVRRARSNYVPVPGGENMPMRALDRSGGGAGGAGTGAPGSGERSAGGTRELYDAFGVGSDEEDEDEDENTALTAHGRLGQQTRLSQGYHDGDLDDEGLSTARTTRGPYRDEPEPEPSASAGEEGITTVSPPQHASDGSGDESWQDASEGAHLRP